MKVIAAATVLIWLTVPTWADEADDKQADGLAASNEPIVLSEVEMDHVVAGDRVFFNYHHFHNSVIDVFEKPFGSEIGVQFIRLY